MTVVMNRFVIVGGGAAGFFGAIRAKETHPDWEVVLLEKGAHLLAKVKVSGGRRCNVTHACFDPAQLIKNYPRGSRELLGPFHRFQPKDTIAWFKERGVELKIEEDGRMFPTTDDSQTIIDCLFKAAKDAGVIIRTECGLVDAKLASPLQVEGEDKRPIEEFVGRSDECTYGTRVPTTDQKFKRKVLCSGLDKSDFLLLLTTQESLRAQKVLLATGGNANSKGWDIAKKLGHTIEPLVPSLFTFNIKDSRLHDLQGVSMPETEVSVPSIKLRAKGPLLVTHWGLSGPGVLKLSAWGAKALSEKSYTFTLIVNWLAQLSAQELHKLLSDGKMNRARQYVNSYGFLGMPQRLWERFVEGANIPPERRWADVTKDEFLALTKELSAGEYQVTGKSTHKEEFVTCGGIKLSEVNFKTMESKKVPGLYFAGEALDIDGVTGGFNFQAAWTTGWIAGSA